MFTGLIEEIGNIQEIKASDNSLYINIGCSKVLDGLKIGDSVAVNGACQTVISMDAKSFTVFASSETLNVTTFKNFKRADKVNLERTMRLSDRLDGHLVSGHVDGLAIVKNISKIGETTEFTFETAGAISKQIVKKGSVAIDGVSLTVADISNSIFKIAIIPHTLSETNLKYLKTGDRVNIETDMIAKYIEKYLLSNDNNSNTDSRIDINLLERNGFI